MKNLKIFIIKDSQLDSLNEYLKATAINHGELLNIKNSIIVMSFDFYTNNIPSVDATNTIIVSADNDAILLSDIIPHNVFQIIDGTPLHENKFHHVVNSEFMSLLDVIEKSKTLSVSKRNGTFFTLNGRNANHRSMLITELFNKACINKGLVIYHNPMKLSDEITSKLGTAPPSDKFVKNFKQPELNAVWHDGYADSAYYSKYNLEIITETTTKSHFVTEKTIRPLSAKMPFLAISSPGYLAHLQQLGFKTFNDVWDESYDNIKNTTERIKAVVEILNDLIQTKQIYNLVNDCNDILKHNASHVHDIALRHKDTKSEQLSKIITTIHKY